MTDRFRWCVAMILATPLFAGCAAGSLRGKSLPALVDARTAGIDDEAAMKAAIDALVPAGMSLAQAEQIMRREGFACSFGYDDASDQDHLACVRTDSQSLWIGARWLVTLDYRDGVIFRSQVKRGLVGP